MVALARFSPTDRGKTLSKIRIRPRRVSDGRQTGAKVRRDSYLAGQCEGRVWRPFAGADAKRYMLAAERYERHTRALRKGKRTGILGHVGLEVLRELLRLVDYKTGRLEPRIDTLQARCGRSRPAIVRALRALKVAGFLDWIRRYVPTGLQGFGPQVRQTSNAYRLALPETAARLLGLFSKAPPVAADLASERAERDQQSKIYAFEDSPLGASVERLAALVRKREFTQRSQSAPGFTLTTARQEG